MKFSSVTFAILLLDNAFMHSVAFQVNPDPISKQAIENTIKREVKIDVPKPVVSRTVPMINVFDDKGFDPKIPFKFDEVMKEIFAVKSNTFQIVPKGPVFTPRPLSESIRTKEPIPPSKRTRERKIIGLDNEPTEYWFNNRIHTFGNVGVFGGLHAICAPLATFLIDTFAYEKLDVRTTISKRLRNMIERSGARVLDLCCGVGMSTRALQSAFKDAEMVVGVDTSPQMIEMARFLTNYQSNMNDFFSEVKHQLEDNAAVVEARHQLEKLQYEISGDISIAKTQYQIIKSKLMKSKKSSCKTAYAIGNAERTIFPDQSFDLVTIMYGFHEAPFLGRYLMLREARRVLEDGGTLALVDIVPEYVPSPTMLAGEPYVIEYQKNIHKQMKKIRGFKNLSYEAIIPGHVGLWLLTREHRRK